MSGWLQASFASLRSSLDEWASFSRIMFHGAVTVSIIGFLNRSMSRATALELVFWSWMHAVPFVWAIYEGVRGGWTLRAIIEALSRTVVMIMFTITVYDVFNRDGRRWRGGIDRNQALSERRNDHRRKN